MAPHRSGPGKSREVPADRTFSPAEPAAAGAFVICMATDTQRRAADSGEGRHPIPIHLTPDLGVAATITLADPDEVRVAVEIEAGHLASSARHDLVEAIFAHPAVQHRTRIRATVPLGDSELLAAFGRHCPDVRTRAAGATCLVDARR
ncbi:MAG TPA: hypothetical protein VIG48_12515 [Jatrophihabitans sp.]|jgi:hypothetical protein